jgi:hypothetical protein
MQFERRRPDVIRAISQRALLDWWNRLRTSAKVPVYTAETPEHLASHAPNLMHCDVVPCEDGLRFRMQVIGSRLVAAYGGSWPGRFLDEALPKRLRQASRQAYTGVVENEQPGYSILATIDRAGRPVDYERLILPFRAAGPAVDRVLTSVEMVSVEGAFDDRELMLSRREAPTYLVHALIDVPAPGPARLPRTSDDDIVDSSR